MSNLWLQCIGEGVGVLLLVLIGNGACFSISHSKMFGNQSGKWVIIVIGWTFAVMVGAMISTAFGSPGHINPAVSIMFSFKDYKLLAYIPCQLIGAMLGQGILDFINWKFIKETSENDKSATRGAHCTNPAIQEKNYVNNFTYELVGTSVLLGALFAISYFQSSSIDSTFSTITFVSLVVMGIGAGLGSATGFAINPARDLGPRMIYQLLKSKMGNGLVSANWEYSWIPVVAPSVAGLIFGLSSLAI